MFVLRLLSQRKITQHRRRCAAAATAAASSIKGRKTFISIQRRRGLREAK